uniref:MARVEL domain-containing protein n=1 Tax=Tetranychus urticae TaxID=32264 RepID=T1KV47_TETUR
MPTLFNKSNLTQLKANIRYFKTIPGIIRLIELVLGIICFACLIGGSSQYYNPHIGSNEYGFSGGSIETSLLLNIYACLFGTFLIIIATLTSSSVPLSPCQSSVTISSTSANKLSFVRIKLMIILQVLPFYLKPFLFHVITLVTG